MSTLYVVATPIGNLEDISLRALRVLGEVKLIAAEDTRKTKRLLNNYDIKTPMTSYYEHNKIIKLDYILDCLEEGDVALVSEAGTPGISDPGYELIKAARDRDIPVVPIPGASAIVSALSVSGLPTDRFTYIGFLPRKAGARNKLLDSVKMDPATLIIYESPRRLTDTMINILEIIGNRNVAVCRELTKIHEEVFKGTLREAIDYFTKPRGEFTLIIEGEKEKKGSQVTKDIENQLDKMRESGLSAREAIGRVSKETGLSRKELYRTWLKKKPI
ncbi:MAG: 16S rRNA (cytidine(1402)-2'-O)-methyltransferase [Dehalococcoidales bacterium]|nr:MAG: 16S rRNA (cytidine(1402)-2'-O)-methyltransferase [Dehalococcoidales bacterium]